MKREVKWGVEGREGGRFKYLEREWVISHYIWLWEGDRQCKSLCISSYRYPGDHSVLPGCISCCRICLAFFWARLKRFLSLSLFFPWFYTHCGDLCIYLFRNNSCHCQIWHMLEQCVCYYYLIPANARNRYLRFLLSGKLTNLSDLEISDLSIFFFTLEYNLAYLFTQCYAFIILFLQLTTSTYFIC